MSKPAINGGYEDSRFISQDLEDHKCGICLKVRKEGVDLACNHSFCNECIGRWTIMHESKNVPCPMCRQVYDNFRFPYTTKDESLIIKCNSCEWKGNMKDLKQHAINVHAHIHLEAIVSCRICDYNVFDKCITCLAVDPMPNCIEWKCESCKIKFHNHCVKRWARTRDGCPMCNVKMENL